jgi:hypothetical protein
MLGGLTNSIVGGKPILSLTISLKNCWKWNCKLFNKSTRSKSRCWNWKLPFFSSRKVRCFNCN